MDDRLEHQVESSDAPAAIHDEDSPDPRKTQAAGPSRTGCAGRAIPTISHIWISPREMVEENSRRHRDVQGIRPEFHRNRDATVAGAQDFRG